MRKVAIFDVDGTIFRSSLVIELTEKLIEQGLFDPEVREEYEKEYIRWRKRKGGYEDYIQATVRTFMRHIKGVHYAEFSNAAQELIWEQQDHVYRYTRDLVRDLKKKKYFLLAVSQSPKTVLDFFCNTMGFDKVYGRIYELGPSDSFTGNIIDEHLIMNKANIVRRAVEKEGLSLKDSIGVGDTEGDIPFLELVERKDVIYEIPTT